MLMILLFPVVMTGCSKEDVEVWLEPVMEEMMAGQAGTAAAKGEEKTELPAIPEIDLSLRINPGMRIAIVSRGKKGEYWDAVQRGMKQALKDINAAYGFSRDEQIRMTYEAPESESDVDSQINMIDAVLSENPDVLCLAACDANSCLAQLETARENGIPVVTFDSKVNIEDENLITAHLGSNNIGIGEMGGYRLAVAIGKMGKVALFCGSDKLQCTTERVEGFKNVVAQYGDIQVIATVYSNETENLTETMKEVLASDPNLVGVFCTSSEVSEAYLNMKKDETLESVAMIGVDATLRQQAAVRSGEEAGIASQYPYAIGYQTIWSAVQAAARRRRSEPVPEILIQPMWIDRKTIEFKKAENYLF